MDESQNAQAMGGPACIVLKMQDNDLNLVPVLSFISVSSKIRIQYLGFSAV